MSSQLQIEANRRNSQKSTGPRSVAGKAASSVNHTTTGIYAASEIIVGERQTDLEDLTSEFHTRFQPGSPDQRFLVDILIHAEWITRRLRRCETGLWDRVIDEYGTGIDTNDLARALDHKTPSFSHLQRRLDHIQRNFERAHKELLRLQAGRPAPQPEPPPAPKPGSSALDLTAVPLPLAPVPETAGPAPHKPAIGFLSAPVAKIGFDSSNRSIPVPSAASSACAERTRPGCSPAAAAAPSGDRLLQVPGARPGQSQTVPPPVEASHQPPAAPRAPNPAFRPALRQSIWKLTSPIAPPPNSL